MLYASIGVGLAFIAEIVYKDLAHTVPDIKNTIPSIINP